MDVVIIVSVSIMPLINISTIAHLINDVETEEVGDALTMNVTINIGAVKTAVSSVAISVVQLDVIKNNFKFNLFLYIFYIDTLYR